ncbi:MAG: hypothetical protein JKX81_09365 [Arenicella sp.]|nr:hypothetical protein [Arenicella sp.]
MSYMKKISSYWFTKFGLEQLSVFYGYLKKSGWRRSVFSHKPVDQVGEPIPWYCYAAIYFLDQRLNQIDKCDIRVFEFGSGNSTLWWSKYASSVISVEDNNEWYSYVLKHKPMNVTYKFAEGEHDYLESLLSEKSNFSFIVVDGTYREACVTEAVKKLTDDGVLIIDNSDWDSLQETLIQLEQNGFRRIEFYSLGPVNGHPWGTSILYRDNNILKL